MQKKDYINRISAEAGIRREEAEQAFETLWNVLTEEILQTGSARISGFGSFRSTKRNERMAVHPRTGEPIYVPAKYKIVFQSSSALEEKLNAPSVEE